MRYGLLLVGVGLVSLLVGVWFAAGWPWVLIVLGGLFVAAGLLSDLESE